MGNRAVITTPKKKLGVYLHWNGGKDSVTAFLSYCEIKNYRNPNNDCYGWARLCQVIGNTLGGTNSLGVDEYNNLDTNNGDNGVYIIDEHWHIIGREFFSGTEQEEYDLFQTLVYINFRQPIHEQVKIYDLIEYVRSVNAEKYTNAQLLIILNEFMDDAKQNLNFLKDLTTVIKELLEDNKTLSETDKRYNELFGADTLLDQAVQMYVDGKINKQDLQLYLDYNSFDSTDIDMNLVEKARQNRIERMK